MTLSFHLFREVSPAAIAHGYSAMGANERKPTAVHIDRKNGWVIQVWTGISATPGCVGTPWEGTSRICVKHSKAKSLNEFNSRKHDIPITWDELQAIKDWLFPGRIALEVYHPRTRWLMPRTCGGCGCCQRGHACRLISKQLRWIGLSRRLAILQLLPIPETV